MQYSMSSQISAFYYENDSQWSFNTLSTAKAQILVTEELAVELFT